MGDSLIPFPYRTNGASYHGAIYLRFQGLSCYLAFTGTKEAYRTEAERSRGISFDDSNIFNTSLFSTCMSCVQESEKTLNVVNVIESGNHRNTSC